MHSPRSPKPNPAQAQFAAQVYIRWRFISAILHRGWWLVTSLYLVLDASLSPLQLVFLGTAQGITVILFEIPTGVVADTFGRKRSILIAHLFMGSAMLATGLVVDFPSLVLTQMLWGLSWTFLSGADVAWVSDELDHQRDVAAVLTRAAKWAQFGAAIGLVSFGTLAFATSRSTSMITAGSGMLLMGIYVLLHFHETRFIKPGQSSIGALYKTLRAGAGAAARDKTIMTILIVTLLINGADEVFSRLFAKRLIDLDLPATPDPIIWLTALGLLTLIIGTLVLHSLEGRLHGQTDYRRFYLAGCMAGAGGLIVFALAPNYQIAMAGVLVVHGIAWNIARVVSVIWINAKATSRIKATVQSFLSQAENLGEVTIGFTLALIAEFVNIPFAIISAACVAAIAVLLVHRTVLRIRVNDNAS